MRRAPAVPTFPYLFVIGSDGRVTWQGSPQDSKYHSYIMKLMSGNRKREPEPGTDEKPDEKQKLPPDYREQVEEAMEKGKVDRMARLLTMAWPLERAPHHPLLSRLWNRLTEELGRSRDEIELRMQKELHASARRMILDARKDFAAFPPAAELGNLWRTLAETEGGEWIDAARKALAAGDAAEARKKLDRVLKYYSDLPPGKVARELLAGMDPEDAGDDDEKNED